MAEHVENSTADALRAFVKYVGSPSVKERLGVLFQLKECVNELPEKGVPRIVKYLGPTLGYYRDTASRTAVAALISRLLEHHPEATINAFVSLLAPYASALLKLTSPHRSSSGAALSALKWSIVLVKFVVNNNGYKDKLKQLIDVQLELVPAALASHNTIICRSTEKCLNTLWKQNASCVAKYSSVLSDTTLTPSHLCLACLLLKYQNSSKQLDIQLKVADMCSVGMRKAKTAVLESYVKNVIGSRVVLPPYLYQSYDGLLRLVVHDEFKGQVHPASQKALLRNPEIILGAYTDLLNGVTIDLSMYCRDIVKVLAVQLISKNESSRTEACLSLRNLARQCSDWEAVEAMCSHLFSVLSGSEGKLNLVEQKLSVATGIGHLSDSAVRGAGTLQNLASSVVEMFIGPIQQEKYPMQLLLPIYAAHEATLARYISSLSLWCAKFSEKVPDSLIQWVKTSLGMKTSTSTVRSAYITCIAKTFHGESLLQCSSLIDVLIQISKKVMSQASQPQQTGESLAAMCVLVRLSSHEIDTETKLAPFWKSMLSTSAKLVLNEKFLSTASDDALRNVVTLARCVLLHHPQRLTPQHSAMFYGALIYCATRHRWPVRKAACDSIRSLTSVIGAGKVALDFVEHFAEMLTSEKIKCAMPGDDQDLETPPDRLPHPKDLAQALFAMSLVEKSDAALKEKIALETLIPAHHPYILAFKRTCWEDILRQMGIDCESFIASHTQQCLAIVMDTQVSQCRASALFTLVRVCPVRVVPKLIDTLRHLLTKKDYMDVTVEQYAIFKTPEGTLYNKAVIESVTTEEVEEKNIKRESKLYSYAEQMAEVELRKELAKKRKKSSDKPQLTPKQQELMDEELSKESAIRSRISQFNAELCKYCSLINAAISANEVTACNHMTVLCRLLLPLLNSPVAAPMCCETFISLSLSAFRSHGKQTLGELVTYCTLRHLKPSCPVNQAWCKELLSVQTQRCVHALTTGDHALTTSCFTILYHLLASVLASKDKAFIAQKQAALELISLHAKMRSSIEKYSTQNDPAYLPLHELIVTLTAFIQKHSGKLQHAAGLALSDICQSAGGGAGCASAAQSDIDVLLACLLSPTMTVRDIALKALVHLVGVFPNKKDNHKSWLYLSRRLWVASFDVDAEIVQLANSVLEMCGMKDSNANKSKENRTAPSEELTLTLIDDITHKAEVIRTAATDTQLHLVQAYPHTVTAVLQQLLDKYEAKLFIQKAKYDEFKRLVHAASEDQWGSRCGIAAALRKLSPLVPSEQIVVLFEFLINRALGDRNEDVRSMMRDASLALVNDHGKDNVATLLPFFEKKLEGTSRTPLSDYVKQSLVVLLGTMARHLDQDNPKIKPIVNKLIKALDTPSQAVQEAVANCLHPLVGGIKEDAREMVKALMRQLLESDTYSVRRGAAYGIAGLIKGLGIMALKQLDVMTTLIDAIQNKKVVKQREGALFAFEMLCVMLGKLFEPYVVHILPHLLLCFGDNNNYVRTAADDTAKAVMSKLSGHGVKLILPSLLKALDEDSWRTKTGSVELLGAMAYCAPKQLSACLPSIVPKLMEVLADSHQKVQKAGAQALKMIGSVIRNPEIQEIVSVLLNALQDPTKKTNACLQTLLDTQFVHFIDAPSLALIMPVVQRAFQDRSTETRKMAAQIIGNMYSLTDQKDLAPYLSTVIPGLKNSLLDPVPEVRSVSARALGAMVRGMGEEGYRELLPWLLSMLTSEGSSVDRSGAAQGFSEVVGGMGLDKLQTIMPDIIQMAERVDIAPHERDGYIMTYIYLPTVFSDDFIPYVGPILPSILQALSDECEFVRDTALRAGQRIINLYSGQAIQLLMPELEAGLFDDNWRIRYSSVQLLGDLLYRISGVSGKMTTESANEDDNFGTERSQEALLNVLGEARRSRVLSGLYMGRSDVAIHVRQSALHVWKVIVSNTPRTLRLILPTLFELLLGCLASASYDKRQIAGRTLGDLVAKLGERVLPEIIPILEKGLDSEECEQRQGVCIGLSEIMAATSREHVSVFANSLIPSVQRALSDPLPEVRTAAARTFDNLHNNIGQRALDDILPYLLNQLENDKTAEYALDGLKQMVVTKSHVVLPNLIPQLIAPPVNTKALALLSSVAGDNLTRHLPRILPALLSSLSVDHDPEKTASILENCKTVVLSVSGEVGVRSVIEELSSSTSNKSTNIQAAAVTILGYFCQLTRNEYTDYLPLLFRVLIQQFVKTDEKVLLASWECLHIITKKLDPSEMLQYISHIRQAVKFASSDLTGTNLPGFCLPKKGIIPLLPIFREGILNGSPELRESAAIGLGEIIKLTSTEGLQPSVLNITGPLIRILGDRFTHQVKIALLETLTLLLGKVGSMLKPFLPQLQTTFIKALNDPHRTVRLRAAAALGHLIVIHVRVDQLFTEILTAVKNADAKSAEGALTTSTRDTMLQALRGCLQGAGGKMSDGLRKQVSQTLLSLLSDVSDSTRQVVAGCIGVLASCLPLDEFTDLMHDTLLDIDESRDWTERHSRSVALYVALKHCPERLYTEEWRDRVTMTITHHINSDRIPICLSGLRCAGFLLKHQLETTALVSSELLAILLKVMKRESNEIKQLLCQVVTYVTQSFSLPREPTRSLIPMLVNATKEKNTVVKCNAEMALFVILQLKNSDDHYKELLPSFDLGMQEALKDVVLKSVKKLKNKTLIWEEIDDTILV